VADLYIDLAGLARTRDSIDRVERLLREPLDVMASRAGSATEIEVLRSRLVEFGDEWDYGISRLAKYAEGVGEALAEIGRTFTELDQRLAEGLDPGSATR
jgi:hypothetical protein